ncbi:Sec-independent protein translocase TatC [Archaeoglobus sulfaticallidus PM70-1]|uniref:Sec-independent protein translocase protein TatC n=1 Tax=Archaeoglobus sulfaticallidus PM70-1 TaxID=387631 RepID=N0BM62_9EURY|nr:twin-arginine translocase subunit TatC [Archaeoglobus sulfaticallidus]AGK61696.1 Sec-independent protein translocase TatC [Archaeoglobus sulfaticallidus PM70-1]
MEPPEDREMELREHLAELKKRTIRISIVILIGIIIVYPYSPELIDSFWQGIFNKKLDMVIYTPTEWIVTRLIFSFVFVFFFSYPYIVYQLYQFAKPGLFEHERKFVKTFIPFSYILFLIGTLLAYEVVIPRLYNWAVVPYFGAEPHLSVKKTIYGAFKIFMAFGLSFQIPVLALIAVKLGMIDSDWLKGKRVIVYILVFILATNITFDISGMSQLIVLAIVVVMYEISIILARFLERKS